MTAYELYIKAKNAEIDLHSLVFSDIVIDAVTVFIGNYCIEQKYAAVLVLKALLPKSFLQCLYQNTDIYPVKRSDSRVYRWKKQILSRGKCEKCGALDHLEAHHIIAWKDWPQGRADINNGMCLCHKCHAYEHRFDGVYRLMTSKRWR